MTKSIFLQRLSATIQFILGFVLGISLIAGISGAAIFAYYKKMSVLPKKPEFPEGQVSTKSTPNTAESSTKIEPLESTVDQTPAIEPESPAETPDIEPEETEEAETEEAEAEVAPPPNAYRAVVTWPEGLSLRAEPDVDAERVGGIPSDASIFILEDSADGKWQRVQLPWNGQEGWVKGGNTEKTVN